MLKRSQDTQVSVCYDQIYFKSHIANSALTIIDSLELRDLKEKVPNISMSN